MPSCFVHRVAACHFRGSTRQRTREFATLVAQAKAGTDTALCGCSIVCDAFCTGVLCGALWCSVVLCGALWCSVVLCCRALCHVSMLQLRARNTKRCIPPSSPSRQLQIQIPSHPYQIRSSRFKKYQISMFDWNRLNQIHVPALHHLRDRVCSWTGLAHSLEQ